MSQFQIYFYNQQQNPGVLYLGNSFFWNISQTFFISLISLLTGFILSQTGYCCIEAACSLSNKQMKVSIKQMQLVSQLSHELRTPISAIIGWNELLMEDELLNSNQKKNMGHIHYASVHLLDLLNTILDVSKLGANKMQLQISSFNLHDLVFTVAEMLVGSTIESNIELLVDYHRNIPQNFFGDPGRIRQILINLLSNAIKFTSSGGEVKVVVRCLASTPKKSYIEIRVEDTGCGIPIELHSLLFREFVQVGVNDAKSPKLGTGLGLYLVKNLTTMMEGKVWVKSMPNIGSIFGVRLPLALKSESINISENQANINSASSIKNKKELDISLSDLDDYEDHNVADTPLFSCNLPNSQEYLKSSTLNISKQKSLKTLDKDALNDSDSSDSALELFKSKKNLASVSGNKIKLFSSPELLTENIDCQISLQTLNFLSSTEFVIVGSSNKFSQFLNNMCKNNWNSKTTQIVDLAKVHDGDSHTNSNSIIRHNMQESTNIISPYEVVSLKNSIPTFMIDMTESINNVQWDDSQESMNLRLKIKDELSNIYNSYTFDTGVYDDLHSSLLSISEWLVMAAEMAIQKSKSIQSSFKLQKLATKNTIKEDKLFYKCNNLRRSYSDPELEGSSEYYYSNFSQIRKKHLTSRFRKFKKSASDSEIHKSTNLDGLIKFTQSNKAECTNTFYKDFKGDRTSFNKDRKFFDKSISPIQNKSFFTNSQYFNASPIKKGLLVIFYGHKQIKTSLIPHILKNYYSVILCSKPITEPTLLNDLEPLIKNLDYAESLLSQPISNDSSILNFNSEPIFNSTKSGFKDFSNQLANSSQHSLDHNNSSPFFLGSKDFSSSVTEEYLANQNHTFLNSVSKGISFYPRENNSDKLQFGTSNNDTNSKVDPSLNRNRNRNHNLKNKSHHVLKDRMLISDVKSLKRQSSKRNPYKRIKNKRSIEHNYNVISKSRSETISLKEFVISERKVSKSVSLSRYFNNHSKIPYEDLRYQSLSQASIKNTIPQHTDPIGNGLGSKNPQNFRALNEKSCSGIFNTCKSYQNNNTDLDLVRQNSSASRKYSYDELSLSEKSAQSNVLKEGNLNIPSTSQPVTNNFTRSSHNKDSPKLLQGAKGVSAMTSLDIRLENSLSQNNNIKNVTLKYGNNYSTNNYMCSKKKIKRSCSVDLSSLDYVIKTPINRFLPKKRAKSIDLTKKSKFKDVYNISDLTGNFFDKSYRGFDKGLLENSALSCKFEPSPKLVSICNTIPEKGIFQKAASNGFVSQDKLADTSSQLKALNKYLYKVENFPTKTPKSSILEIKNKINLKKSISKNPPVNLNNNRLQGHFAKNEVNKPNELFHNNQSICSSSVKVITPKTNLKSIPNIGSENKISVCSFFLKRKSKFVQSYKALVDIENRHFDSLQDLNISDLKAPKSGNELITDIQSINRKENKVSSIIRPIDRVSIYQKSFSTIKLDKVISRNDNLLSSYHPNTINNVSYEMFRNFCIRQRDDNLNNFERYMFENHLSVDLSFISNRFSLDFETTLQSPTDASYQDNENHIELPNFHSSYQREKKNINSVDIYLKNRAKINEPLNLNSYIHAAVMTEYLNNVILEYKRILANNSHNIGHSRTASSKTDIGNLKKSNSKLKSRSNSVHLSFPTNNYKTCEMLTPDVSNTHINLLKNHLLTQENEISASKENLDDQLFSRNLDSKSFPNLSKQHTKPIYNDEESLKFLDNTLFDHSNSESKIFGKIDFCNVYDSNHSNSAFSSEYLEKKNQVISSSVAESFKNFSNIKCANSLDFLKGSIKPFSSALDNSSSLFSHNIDKKLACTKSSRLNDRSISDFSDVREIQNDDYKAYLNSEIEKPVISCHNLNFSNRNISDSTSKSSVASHEIVDKISNNNSIDTLSSKVLDHKKAYEDDNFHCSTTLNKNSTSSIESPAIKSTQPLSKSYQASFLRFKSTQNLNHSSKKNASLFEIPKYKNSTDFYNKPRKNLSFSTFPSKENIYSSLMNSNVLVDKDNFRNSYNKQFQIYEPSNLKNSDLILGKCSIPSPRVLVADDSSPNRMLLVSQLKKLGITNIDSASDGIAACNLFKPGKYCLIFMDIQMPQVDGYQATNYIRQVEKDQLNRLDGDAADASRISFSDSTQLLTAPSKNGEKKIIVSKGRILTSQKNVRKSVNNSKPLISSDNFGLVQDGSYNEFTTANGANNFSRSIILALSADTSVKELFNSNINKGTMGFDSVYSKPISLKDLYTTISFWLPWYQFPESVLKKFSENE
ncbi:Hybrid signal transduction histidine kinase K [Smittium culicis]|uniref:histidine kinase n=1 Tax=Smittium culicis TaxID=133412 RepID=A0A1R1YDJ1_9FUNG|nr:Hybrid signal transduction histidine kinase K [Smittium culicis]